MDAAFMGRALELAARGRGHVSPNPMVGAVVVRDGAIVGEGWHASLGAAHAEVEALRLAAGQARGATMYVTLEPCNHHGRTPPCAPALLEAGLRRVVVAIADPNTRVHGGGLQWLAARGVQVECGMREPEARALNRAFFTWCERARPFVTLKTALSLDGRIACHTGQSQWITNELSRTCVHEERANHDAILVGVGTVLADDPRLDVRLPGSHRLPWRIVLDSALRTPPTARMLNDGQAAPLLFTTERAATSRRTRLESAGAETVVVQQDADGRVDVSAVLRHLAVREITSVLVEGGGRIQASFLQSGNVDRVLSFIAPLILMGRDAPTPLGREAAAVPDTLALHSVNLRRYGDDMLIEGFMD